VADHLPIEQRTLQLWTSNSWRRFHFREGGIACEPITQPDGHPDLHFEGGPEGPVARRIVACWNALLGVGTHFLEHVPETPGFTILQAQVQRIKQLERALDARMDVVNIERERAEKAEAALRELVRLKELNRRIHSPKEFKADPDGYLAAIEEYERRSTAAWESVRAIVKEQP
jgi:hypothetical protein